MKYYIVLAALALLLVGCTKNEEMETKEALADETQIEEQIEEQIDEQSEASIIVQELSKVKEAKTAEELAEIPSGILTQDFSIGRETSMWAMKEVPDDIVIQFLEEIEVLTSEASDPDIIFSSLLYYLGSPQYEYAVGRLLNYHPDFDEPLLPEPYEETESVEQEAAPSKAIILLDASSSMLLNANGRLKMDTAKSAVRSFASTMGNESAVSLYVYGHAGTQARSDKELSCGTIDEVYPLGKYDQSEFNDAVAAVSAKGWTPLAGAIKQVREDHQSTLDDITVYIVSDGAETCDGDPVAEALAFADGNPDRHVNIIGFQVDQLAESQLKAVAEA